MAKDGITNYVGSIRAQEGGLILSDINAGARQAELKFAAVTVTSAELLALNATPKTLIAAPGAGKIIIPLMALAVLSAGTAYAAIAAGEDLTMGYTDGSGVIASNTLETTGFLDQATAQVRTFKPIATDLTPAANAALVLHLETGEITTGTGILSLFIVYFILETGL